MHSVSSRGGGARLRRRNAYLIATLVIVAALVAAGAILAYLYRHNSGANQASGSQPGVCPLTGLPAPGGQVPQRPALAVKVDNVGAARPQSGLDHSDLVFEEPVEGGLTRLVAVFQCAQASVVEPIRSARLVDPDILAPLGHALFAFDGGINPALDKVDSSPLINVGLARDPQAYWRDPSRAAPHNLAASTSALWKAGSDQGASPSAPPPLFQYGSLPAGVASTPATSVHIPFSGSSDVEWTWSSSTNAWLRSNLDPPAGPTVLTDGARVSAANVIVQQVTLTPSPYVEDATGEHENYVQLTGSGPMALYRDGEVISGTWTRASLSEPTQLTSSSGQPVPLSPGVTWVELVPSNVTVTPAP